VYELSELHSEMIWGAAKMMGSNGEIELCSVANGEEHSFTVTSIHSVVALLRIIVLHIIYKLALAFTLVIRSAPEAIT